MRLFIMMVLQLAIWGAWVPKLMPDMVMPGFSANQQALVGSCWGIAPVVGIFLSNQFADRHFAAERFLAFILASAFHSPTAGPAGSKEYA